MQQKKAAAKKFRSDWVATLEELRNRQDYSKNMLEQQGIMTRSQYNRMLKAKKSPRYDVLERIIYSIGCSWEDWAAELKKTQSPQKSAAKKGLGR